MTTLRIRFLAVCLFAAYAAYTATTATAAPVPAPARKAPPPAKKVPNPAWDWLFLIDREKFVKAAAEELRGEPPPLGLLNLSVHLLAAPIPVPVYREVGTEKPRRTVSPARSTQAE